MQRNWRFQFPQLIHFSQPGNSRFSVLRSPWESAAAVLFRLCIFQPNAFVIGGAISSQEENLLALVRAKLDKPAVVAVVLGRP